jgi:hypothetical protein
MQVVASSSTLFPPSDRIVPTSIEPWLPKPWQCEDPSDLKQTWSRKFRVQHAWYPILRGTADRGPSYLPAVWSRVGHAFWNELRTRWLSANASDHFRRWCARLGREDLPSAERRQRCSTHRRHGRVRLAPICPGSIRGQANDPNNGICATQRWFLATALQLQNLGRFGDHRGRPRCPATAKVELTYWTNLNYHHNLRVTLTSTLLHTP